MIILISASIFTILIVIVYRVFLSDDDEIPSTSSIDASPHYRPRLIQQTPIKQNLIGIRAPTHDLNAPYLPKPIQQRTTLSQSFFRPQHFTRFEQMFEYPELVSFDDLKRNYHFGMGNFRIDPFGKWHYGLCVVLFSVVLVFRTILWVFECLGYLFFHVMVRLIFEVIIRSLFWVIRGIFHFIGHLFDGV